jgi:hypothetical protein
MKRETITGKSFIAAGVFVIASLLSAPAMAQKWESSGAPFVKGSKSLGVSAGAGIEYGYYGDYNTLPALAITYDQGIINNVGPGTIGVGGIAAVKTAWYNYKSTGNRARWNNYFIGVRGTYHLTLLKDKNNKFDPYAGVTAGVRVMDYKDDAYETNPHDYNKVNSVVGAFIGAKYNFVPSFGAFAEVGYDISYARIGIAANF